MQFFSIVLVFVFAAVGYGVLHDMVTVHICPQYFTVAHPPLFNTESLPLLAVAWGSTASALAGLPLGFVVAGAAQNGRRLPRIGLLKLFPYLARLFVAVATTAVLAGVLGLSLFNAGVLSGPEGYGDLIPPDLHARFVTVWWAHAGSYLAAFVGCAALAVFVLRKRKLNGAA